jgi:hypothetical protein
MAGFASLFEFTLVRILVAVRTTRKLNAYIARMPIGARGVALFTSNVEMHSGQRIARLGMIEILRFDFRALPIRC